MTIYSQESTASDVAELLARHIVGKVILITGGSPQGLGATAALAIAPHNPALIILTGRNRSLLEETEKAIQAKAATQTRLLIFDLANLKSIHEAAASLNRYPEKIDVLINNAGIMATPFEKTVDGLESQFGVNHLGHFLFTKLIVGKIPRGGRIINVSSDGYQMGGVRFDDPNFENGPYDKWKSYAQSKTANILFSEALAERLQSRGIFSFSLHPGGGVYTNLGKYMTTEDFAMLSSVTILTLEQGASSYVAAAFDPELESSNGAYLEFCAPVQIKEECPWARGKENADKLWALSEDMVRKKFVV